MNNSDDLRQAIDTIQNYTGPPPLIPRLDDPRLDSWAIIEAIRKARQMTDYETFRRWLVDTALGLRDIDEDAWIVVTCQDEQVWVDGSLYDCPENTGHMIAEKIGVPYGSRITIEVGLDLRGIKVKAQWQIT